MALIVHRICNNLLHGKKLSYGLRGQEMDFRHSSHILMTWMEMDRVQPAFSSTISPCTVTRSTFKQARIGP